MKATSPSISSNRTRSSCSKLVVGILHKHIGIHVFIIIRSHLNFVAQCHRTCSIVPIIIDVLLLLLLLLLILLCLLKQKLRKLQSLQKLGGRGGQGESNAMLKWIEGGGGEGGGGHKLIVFIWERGEGGGRIDNGPFGSNFYVMVMLMSMMMLLIAGGR
jgi:hypothetical protein